MASSVKHAFAVLRGGRTGDPNAAQGLLDSLPPHQLAARSRAEERSNRPKPPSSYAKKYRMGMRVY